MKIKNYDFDKLKVEDVGEGFKKEKPIKRLAREELDKILRPGKDVKRTTDFLIAPKLLGIKDIARAQGIGIRDIPNGKRIKPEDV